MAVNLKGVWLTAKHAIPHVSNAATARSSLSLVKKRAQGEPFTAAYNASKHAVHGLMKTLAIELGPYEINVNAICPTSMGAMGRTTSPPPYWEMVTGIEDATERDFDAWAGTQNLFERDTRVTPEEVAEGVCGSLPTALTSSLGTPCQWTRAGSPSGAAERHLERRPSRQERLVPRTGLERPSTSLRTVALLGPPGKGRALLPIGLRIRSKAAKPQRPSFLTTMLTTPSRHSARWSGR